MHRRPTSSLTLMALMTLLTGLGVPAAPPAQAQMEPRLTLPRSTVQRPGQEPMSLGPTDGNPVVASVDGYPIYLQDLGEVMRSLPEQMRQMPFEVLYPALVDRMVDHQSLVIMAKRRGLEENPEVAREIKRATERILEAAYLDREVRPKITDQQVQAAYQRQFANRPATEEVRARHILVGSEAEARRLIEELRQGADFATLARDYSKDPTGKNGGDVGFFRREQVWPDFGDLAFSLQPGQVGNNPIRNEFGWHVVRVDERRQVAVPGFSEIEPSLRQELTAQSVRTAIDAARSQVIIRRFNLDGTDLEIGPRFRSTISPEETSKAAPMPSVPAGR